LFIFAPSKYSENAFFGAYFSEESRDENRIANEVKCKEMTGSREALLPVIMLS
jgi:hypothetical protein